jgi:hypothetical protein
MGPRVPRQGDDASRNRRLVHHATILEMYVESYRARERTRSDGKPPPSDNHGGA